MTEIFRPCAVAVVFNSKGNVLLCNRIDTANEAWQFPQGGIEKDETPQVAAQRELFEETNIVSVKHLYTDALPTRYEFPQFVKDKFKSKGIFTAGQEVYFSLFYFEGLETEICLATAYPEFEQYRWENFDFAVAHIVDFKKEVYTLAKKHLAPLIEQYLESIS